MSARLLPSASPMPVSSSTLSKPNASLFPFSSNLAIPRSSSLWSSCERGSQTKGVRCNSSIWPGGPGSGDGDSRTILDAFFLGKAVAEAINERIESTVGEFLSAVGRLQAEQQKQVQDFQEDVLERAKKAKEKAAREALEAQGLIPKPAVETRDADSIVSTTSESATDPVTLAQSTNASETYPGPAKEEEPSLSSSTDD